MGFFLCVEHFDDTYLRMSSAGALFVKQPHRSHPVKMSNHLAVLRAAGLVTYRRQGRVVRYQFASPEAANLVSNLTTLANAEPGNPAETHQPS